MNHLALGVRSLRRTPVFWLGIVLTMGIALAATVCVFTLLNSYLLRPLPADPDNRLAVVYEYSLKGGRTNASRVTFANAVAVAERVTAFSRVGILRNESVTVHGAGGTEVAFVQRVSPDVLAMIGARAVLGRVFTPADAVVAGQKAVVLSDALWRRRFGGNANAIGRSVQLDHTSYRIVGVLPPEFRIPTSDDNPQAWLAMPPEEYLREDRVQRRQHVLGELRPGRSLASAHAELGQLAATLRAEQPAANADRALQAISMRDDLLGGFGTLLLLLQSAVLLVLGVACLNCLCLLVARGLQRRRELAVRLALGARNRHLLQQLLVEALGLALPAALLALAAVLVGLPMLTAQLPPVTPLLAMGRPKLDLAVVGAVGGAAVLVAVIFTLVPLAQSWRLNLEATLREGGRMLGSVAGVRATRWLIMGQVALSLALLVSALLLLRSQQRLAQLDPGYAIAELDQFRVGLRGDAFRDPVRRLQFYRQLEDSLRELPGVTDVAAMSFLLVQPPIGYLGFTQEGDGLRMQESPKRSTVRAVNPNIFSVLGLQLIEGRLLQETDEAGKPTVAVISASLARKYWPDASPLGQRVRLEGDGDALVEIVGVVSDTISIGNQPQPVDSFYCTIAQRPPAGLGMSMVMRMSGPFLSSDTLQRAVARIDPNMQFFQHASLPVLYHQAAWQSRYMMMLIAAFAGLALLLALGGIYAVNSFRVAQRVPEFGIRMALGADAAEVLRQVLVENLRLVAGGMAGGFVLALLAGFGLRGFLYAVTPFDPAAYAAGAAAMVVACSLAALVPARRASRVDPIVALRAE